MIELFISVIIPWIITAFLIVVFLSFLYYIPRLLVQFIRMPLFVKLVVIVALVAGVLVRFYWVPNVHRIYYDEDRYLSYAVTFARFGEAKSIEYATQTKLVKGTPDKAIRLTVPVINAWGMKLFGYTENTLFIIAKIFSSFQILLLLILAYQLFKSHTAALVSALGMALLPGPVFWSPSLNLDSYFVFFALLSFVATGLYAKKATVINGALLIASLFLLLCVRLEAFLFIPIFIWALFIIRREPQVQFITKADIPYIVFGSTFIGLRALASISVVNQQWCCADALPIEAFYPSYFIRNLLPNLLQLFTRIEFPFVITILAIISIVRMQNKKVALLTLWFLSYFILYSLYYAGMLYSEEFSGSYGRYFLILIPPLLMLAGHTVWLLQKYIEKLSLIRKIVYISLFIGVFVTLSFGTFASYRTLVSTSPYYRGVDEGPAFIHSYTEHYLAPNTPKDSIILTSMTAYFAMIGRTTGLAGLFIDDIEIRDLVLSELKAGKRVFSVFPYQCSVDPKACDKIIKYVDYYPVKTKKEPPGGSYFAEIKLNSATPSGALKK